MAKTLLSRAFRRQTLQYSFGVGLYTPHSVSQVFLELHRANNVLEGSL